MSISRNSRNLNPGNTPHPMILINGMRVLTNKNLTVAGTPVEVEMTRRDRWFSWPWRPWVKTRMYTPREPDPHAYKMSDMRDGLLLVMHPETLKQVMEARKHGK